jgi:hypothetical protein
MDRGKGGDTQFPVQPAGNALGVDEEVLAIVEQAHSCAREKDGRLIEVVRKKSSTRMENN